MIWKGIVGRNFTPDAFREYVAGLTWGAWQPEFITLHHTAVPSLAQRPNGFNNASMSGLERYYRDEMGWSAAPHLFVDDQPAGIWVFTPLTTPGVHAKSFNGRSLGLEMLGNYDVEDFDTGRGALVRDNAVAAIGILSKALGIDPDSMMCHRDEPSTSKTCPGNNVDEVAFIRAVKDYQGAGEAPSEGGVPETTDALLGEAWGIQTEPARPVTETGESASQAPSAPPDHFAQPSNMVWHPGELNLARKYLPVFCAAADAYIWPDELLPKMQQLLGPRWMTWVLMGIASRESRMGLLLDAEGKGDGGHGHGIMQVDNRWHKAFCDSDKWSNLAASLEYVHKTVIVPSFNYLGEHCWEQVGEDYGALFRATVAAYNAGPGNVRKALEAGTGVDSLTTGRDYAKDVLARAKALYGALT